MSGGVRNVSVSNCQFLGTDVGLRFKSKRGRGGIVENIWITNVSMMDIPTEPITFNLYYGGKSALWEAPVPCHAPVVKAKTFCQGKESLPITLKTE